MKSIFASARVTFSVAVILRLALLQYGAFQDKYSPLKYTDIDYFVFTDAARNVHRGRSPYDRDTYRYTPLLAWALLPTAWGGAWFAFGKLLFAASDILAGWLIYTTLRSSYGMPKERALRFASLWLLNPMVAQISTRGSSEGLLAVIVMALLWATLRQRYILAGCLLGLAVHLKIYPFIYASSILWWLDELPASSSRFQNRMLRRSIASLVSPAQVTMVSCSLVVFVGLNLGMLSVYGLPFLSHTYFYHVVRSDHRHNFAPYNLLLYVNSSPVNLASWHPESVAFFPQLVISAIAIPLVLAKRDLPAAMLAQTFSFVTFNKVCTSQYFLWYMVFLPFYLPSSSLLRRPSKGFACLGLWILGQVFWLQQGYQLEFLGNSTFLPGLWAAGLLFFLVNIYILGVVVSDIRQHVPGRIEGTDIHR